MDKLYIQSETGCCPRFNPTPWNEKEIFWQDKLFIKDSVPCIFHIPLNFSKVVVKNMEKIEDANALTSQTLMLSDAKSLWKIDLYIAVSKEVHNAKMIKFSGIFLTKVFEGPFQNVGKWIKEMESYVKSKGNEIKKMYFCYTTCPKCAKAYGKNYVIIFAKI
jgi:hypothetical protein